MTVNMSRFGILSLEIYSYLNPEVYNGEIDLDRIDKKKLQRYSTSIHILNESFAKVKRYEDYFENFYPSTDSISHAEALHHHIHSYLEDIYLLSEAIKKLFGDLKNDLQKIAPNHEEVCSSLDTCLSRILPMFDRAREHRRKHRHALGRFLDYDLLRSTSIQNFTKEGHPFLEHLKEGAEEYLADEANKAFFESKKHWCELSRQNNRVISEQIERLFLSIEDLFYQLLDIEPIIMSKIKDKLPQYAPFQPES